MKKPGRDAVLFERIGRGLLEGFSYFGVVGVGEIGALDHEDVDEIFLRVDPGLGAVGATVAEGAGGEHGGHALWLAHDAAADAPAVAGGEAGFVIGELDSGEELDRFTLENSMA